MEKIKDCIGLVVKVVIFMALLAIFCVFFLLPVVTQYSEKYSNIAKLSKTADKIEVPTISICTGWKKSIMDKYKITTQLFFAPTSNESNLPKDTTIEDVYSDVTYKLNEDFAIGLVEGAAKQPKSLMLGMNEEVFSGEAISKYNVKEMPSFKYGMCYIIIPNETFMTPYVDVLTLLVAKNNTSIKDKMDKVMIQISSKYSFLTIFSSVAGMETEMMSQDFGLGNNQLTIAYTGENTEYIQDCSEMSFFNCWATKIAMSEEFKCPKKCVPFTLQLMMDTIDHNIPRCGTDAEYYCMIGTEGLRTVFKLKSTCQKQCNYKGSKLVVQKTDESYSYQLGSMQITVQMYVLPQILYNKEYLIYDTIGMIGSIGGSLGLFLGFSLFGTICMIMDFILRKVRC